MSIKERISSHINEILGDGEFFLVDVLMSGSEAGGKITIYLDGDKDVSIAKCAEVTRKLLNYPDLEEIQESFMLEISSPGLDYPLKSPRQYKKNIGRKIRVTQNDEKVRSGKIKAVESNGVLLEEEVKEEGKKKTAVMDVFIPFDQVKKTNIIISFS
jgi:ribosome maturation factor RimP